MSVMLPLLGSGACSGLPHNVCNHMLTSRRPACSQPRLQRKLIARHRPHAQNSDFFFDIPEILDEDDGEEPTVPSSEDMPRWQRKRLETAYAAGKRKANIKQLAGDLKMDRKDVLAWFKERAKQPDPPGWPLAKPNGMAEQSQPFEAKQAVREEDEDVNRRFADRQREPGGDFAKKRLGRAVEMTLEKVFERHRWPSQEMIGSICELHPGVPAVRIKMWFEEARRRNPSSGRR